MPTPNDQLKDDIAKLVERKKAGFEPKTADPIKSIDAFIAKEVLRLSDITDLYAPKNNDTAMNTLFRQFYATAIPSCR